MRTSAPITRGSVPQWKEPVLMFGGLEDKLESRVRSVAASEKKCTYGHWCIYIGYKRSALEHQVFIVDSLMRFSCHTFLCSTLNPADVQPHWSSKAAHKGHLEFRTLESNFVLHKQRQRHCWVTLFISFAPLGVQRVHLEPAVNFVQEQRIWNLGHCLIYWDMSLVNKSISHTQNVKTNMIFFFWQDCDMCGLICVSMETYLQHLNDSLRWIHPSLIRALSWSWSYWYLIESGGNLSFGYVYANI